ncbi:NAD(P)-dependent oxidoreductase [Chryseobacterium sp. Ch-15]|uniref:NAD(P)-dependent oxidoreductase n=1 Tax=Chryseobacterium muglaense TaxID=2893752 RepID=A0A9Q3YT55_9FLAO|nr:NAD(P)-dependent oxidoreductase [Chryseobacterium muglaense]MBD3905438.1 NAD(P)-dependent oxidoreductase [Chryseobacterium muglaense]MCC9036489.1 NAD(P)-dependent oxidoreductase [Chryseobacterium muglaense]MCM2555414.1 NAD(P)-dependent oxidoreductase [Chryseobacterium muglaense]
MNYFIFGGSGFIGTHLINLLKAQKPDSSIYNLDIIENTHNGNSIFVNCDVRKKINIKIPVSEKDVVFNFAAVHITPGHPDFEYFETNILGAENVIEFCEKNGVEKVVFTSSIAPYGASEEMKTETTIPMPNTPYGISKIVAEKIHLAWQNKKENVRQLTIVRPGVVFGKGENGNFTRLYFGIKDGKFLYPGRKDTIKACIYVKELVCFMLFRLNENQRNVEIYNCAYFPAFTIEQIAETMMKVTNSKRHIPKIPGFVLKAIATIVGSLGGKKLGIHPDRVKKLMISTNISGEKLANSCYQFHYSFEDALKDWYQDNDNQYLQ